MVLLRMVIHPYKRKNSPQTKLYNLRRAFFSKFFFADRNKKKCAIYVVIKSVKKKCLRKYSEQKIKVKSILSWFINQEDCFKSVLGRDALKKCILPL